MTIRPEDEDRVKDLAKMLDLRCDRCGKTIGKGNNLVMIVDPNTKAIYCSVECLDGMPE